MSLPEIHNKIFEIRGLKIMLDFDLAELYEVETRRLNEQVKRNTDKFPEDFMFRLTEKEWEIMQPHILMNSMNSNLSQIAMSPKNGNLSQIAMSSRKHRGKIYTPYAFTEHGVTMLASVLRSKTAIAMNIAIVRAFTAMRHFANSHKDLFEQINDLRKEMQTRIGEHDSQLAAIYNALENLLDTDAEKKAKEDAWKNRKRIGYK